MANPKIKKESDADNEVSIDAEQMPVGTAYSHLSVSALREEYTRTLGKPADTITPQNMIADLLFQFELQKVLAYQEEIYNELNRTPAND